MSQNAAMILRLHPGVIVTALVLVRGLPADGLGGAPVEAAHAQHAPGLCPRRLAAEQGNGAAGTDLLAQPALDARICDQERLCRPAVGVERIGRGGAQAGGLALAAVVVADPQRADGPGGVVNILLRPVQGLLDLHVLRDPEHGHIVVHHRHAELGGQGDALALQPLRHLTGGVAGGLAAGEDQIDILVRIARQAELIQEKGQNAGQALEIGGNDETDPGFVGDVVLIAAAADGVPDKDQPVLRGGGDALSRIFAVAGGGKIEDHGHSPLE